MEGFKQGRNTVGRDAILTEAGVCLGELDTLGIAGENGIGIAKADTLDGCEYIRLALLNQAQRIICDSTESLILLLGEDGFDKGVALGKACHFAIVLEGLDLVGVPILGVKHKGGAQGRGSARVSGVQPALDDRMRVRGVSLYGTHNLTGDDGKITG